MLLCAALAADARELFPQHVDYNLPRFRRKADPVQTREVSAHCAHVFDRFHSTRTRVPAQEIVLRCEYTSLPCVMFRRFHFVFMVNLPTN